MNIETIKKKLQPQTTPHGTVISLPTLEESLWLVNEVESLNEDREWQIKQNVRMFSVIEEAVKYLDTNHLTNIAHGSILHQQLREAMEIDPV